MHAGNHTPTNYRGFLPGIMTRRLGSAPAHRRPAELSAGVQATGSFAGPQIPNVSGFHSTGPSNRRSGMRSASRTSASWSSARCQVCTEAPVDPETESHLLHARFALDVEEFRFDEHVRIAVRSRERHRHQRPFREEDIAVLDRLRRDPYGARDRAEVPHALFDSTRGEIRALDESSPLLGMRAEECDTTAELVARRVGSGHEQRFGQHDQFVAREPVAFLLDRDERANRSSPGASRRCSTRSRTYASRSADAL